MKIIEKGLANRKQVCLSHTVKSGKTKGKKVRGYVYDYLGGGFTYMLFSPQIWRNDPI